MGRGSVKLPFCLPYEPQLSGDDVRSCLSVAVELRADKGPCRCPIEAPASPLTRLLSQLWQSPEALVQNATLQ